MSQKIGTEACIEFPPETTGQILFAVTFPGRRIKQAELRLGDVLVGRLSAEDIYRGVDCDPPKIVPLNFLGDEIPVHADMVDGARVTLTWDMDPNDPTYPSLSTRHVAKCPRKRGEDFHQDVFVAGKKMRLIYTQGICGLAVGNQ